MDKLVETLKKINIYIILIAASVGLLIGNICCRFLFPAMPEEEFLIRISIVNLIVLAILYKIINWINDLKES